MPLKIHGRGHSPNLLTKVCHWCACVRHWVQRTIVASSTATAFRTLPCMPYKNACRKAASTSIDTWCCSAMTSCVVKKRLSAFLLFVAGFLRARIALSFGIIWTTRACFCCCVNLFTARCALKCSSVAKCFHAVFIWFDLRVRPGSLSFLLLIANSQQVLHLHRHAFGPSSRTAGSFSKQDVPSTITHTVNVQNAP